MDRLSPQAISALTAVGATAGLGCAIGGLYYWYYNSRTKSHGPLTQKSIFDRDGKDIQIDYFNERIEGKRRILICGSGLMVPALLDYLIRRKENFVTIGTNIIEDANKLIHGKRQCRATIMDVTDHEKMGMLVKEHDIVISMVPHTLHMHVAKACLREKKNMVTASYISDDMKKLDEEVKRENLIFLNECGVDPGIDIMSTIKVLHETEANGGKVVGYESWCGGLPAPDCIDNPLGYKFSWSPVGALSALRNGARFLKDGKVVDIPADELLASTEVKDFIMSLNLEGYPNRDSLHYIEKFGMKDIKTTFRRGTLRYKGFAELMQAFKAVGFLDDAKVDVVKDEVSRRELLAYLTENIPDKELSPKISSILSELGIHNDDHALIQRVLLKAFGPSVLTNTKAFEVKVRKFAKAIKYFDFLAEYLKAPTTKPIFHILCDIFQEKLKFEDKEKDCVYMHHIFEIQLSQESDQTRKLHSRMFAIGDPIERGHVNEHGHKHEHRYSAMAKTVGLPTAIATQLILDRKVAERGIISPVHKDLYEPILHELEKEGIKLSEEWE